MIKLEISGTDTADFAAQLAAVAQLMAGVAPPATAPTGRGKGKADKPDPTGGADPAKDGASSEATGASDAAVTRESVATKCTQYSSKGGVAALKELFVEFGAENGKWSGVADDKLVALNARLDDLLA